MKRNPIALLTILLLITGALCAQEAELPPEGTPLGFPDQAGSFAIYYDARAEPPCYVGLCYLGGNEVAIRVYEPGSEQELLVLETLYTVDDGEGGTELDPGSINIIRGDINAEVSQRILPLVWNWINAWIQSRSNFDDTIAYEFEYDGMYRFEGWVPLLQLRQIDEGVELTTAGIASSVTDPAFFAWTGFPQPETGPSVTLAAGGNSASAEKSLTGFWTPDSNWTVDDQRVWKVTKETVQDAYVYEEVLPPETIEGMSTELLLKALLTRTGAQLIAPSVQLSEEGETVFLSFKVYDSETNTVTVQVKRMLGNSDGGLAILNFGAFESVWVENESYFTELLLR